MKQSIVEACGFEVVIDDFGYDDCVEVGQPFDLPPGIIGLSCFTMIHDGYELWFDGFVIDDDIYNIMDAVHVDMFAGASFLEHNGITVKPSRHQIMFGDHILCSPTVGRLLPKECVRALMLKVRQSVNIIYRELVTECERGEIVIMCEGRVSVLSVDADG